MAIWRLTAKRDAAHGRIKKGQSVTITTIGTSTKPNSSQVKKAFDLSSTIVSATDANFIMEKIG